MCLPKAEKVANIIPKANAAPDKAPEPVAIATGAEAVRKAGRNSLRIDLASSGPRSGVNV